MKTLFSLALLLSLNFAASAQDNLTIKSSIKTEGLPDDLAAFGEMDLVTYIKGDKTKTETSGMMFSNITYYDLKTLTYLSEYMGNKSGCVATKAELEEHDKKEKKSKSPKITYTTEKKMIAGYECTKAILTYPSEGEESVPVTLAAESKKENTSIVWFTEKIKAPSREMRKANKKGMDLGDLKGMPLEMESTMKMQGMDVTIRMSTKEISTAKLSDATFVPNTEGYTMMSYKEMMEKMKAK